MEEDIEERKIEIEKDADKHNNRIIIIYFSFEIS